MTLDSKRHAVDGLASIKEACTFLSIGKSSLYQLMSRGEIPFVFVGSNRKIPRAALVEFTQRILEEKRITLTS
jgi:excisionase family DNA binding protein